MDFNYALVDFAPAVNRSVSSGGTHFGELYWDHFHNYLDVMHPAAAAIVWEWEDLGNLKLPECDESVRGSWQDRIRPHRWEFRSPERNVPLGMLCPSVDAHGGGRTRTRRLISTQE